MSKATAECSGSTFDEMMVPVKLGTSIAPSGQENVINSHNHLGIGFRVVHTTGVVYASFGGGSGGGNDSTGWLDSVEEEVVFELNRKVESNFIVQIYKLVESPAPVPGVAVTIRFPVKARMRVVHGPGPGGSELIETSPQMVSATFFINYVINAGGGGGGGGGDDDGGGGGGGGGGAAATCATPTIPPQVMAPVKTTQFGGAGTVAGGKNFILEYANCSNLSRIRYKITSNGTSPDIALGLLPLISPSTASGVLVQVRDAPSGSFSALEDTPLGIWRNINTTDSSYTVPMQVRYYRHTGPLSPGSVHAGMTIISEYP